MDETPAASEATGEAASDPSNEASLSSEAADAKSSAPSKRKRSPEPEPEPIKRQAPDSPSTASATVTAPVGGKEALDAAAAAAISTRNEDSLKLSAEEEVKAKAYAAAAAAAEARAEARIKDAAAVAAATATATAAAGGGEADKTSMTEVEDSIDEAEPAKEVIHGLEDRSTNCPYLDTINRSILDFDFEKLCSVNMSHLNVYACLVCGKYFQGRGPSTHAYTHSLMSDHHVFLNLGTLKFYCLPDNYEIIDSSLEDIKYACHIIFVVYRTTLTFSGGCPSLFLMHGSSLA